MLKLLENPPLLHPAVEELAAVEGSWWVAHTKARSEKAFAWDLLHRDVRYFLPMTERIRFSGGRKRCVLMPLFPSYVFFCGDEDDRYVAMTTHRLCQTIDVPNREELVMQLTAIEKALAGKARLDPYPFAVAGRRCRVASGPFCGTEGVVVGRNSGRNKRLRIILEVSILGQAASMEIDGDLLEPA